MNEKVDFKKTLALYRARTGVFDVVEVPDTSYLVLDGAGDPNSSPAFAEAIGALYPLAYRLKFASKARGRDYVVPPMEGLWWAEDMAAFTTSRDKTRWRWTLMLMVPEWLGPADVEAARADVTSKGAPPRLDEVQVETIAEGTCVQTLHVGPFEEEGPVLERLHHEILPRRGLRPTGRHHEIYLSDFRRTAPAKLRTILRQPVEARE